jgi:hypothetical protein
MNKDKILNHVNDPKFLVAHSRVYNFLGRWQDQESRENHFGVNRYDVLGVILNGSGGLWL